MTEKLVTSLEPGDIVPKRGIVIHPPAEQQGCIAITYLVEGGGVEKMLYMNPDGRSEPVSGTDYEAIYSHLHPMPMFERRERMYVPDVIEKEQRKKAMAERGRALARKANREAAEMRRNKMQKGSTKGNEASKTSNKKRH